VEAHGTGTSLGDPIEAQALLATYGQDRVVPLWLGSVKSNIGHTQGAAGVAGVIKMVQAMRHGVLPKSLHVDEPTSVVDWSAGAVEVLAEAREWPRVGRPRRAGVSSFGISGTNAHVIIEQAPEAEAPDAFAEAGIVPLLVSARGPAALRGQSDRLRSFMDASAASPADIGSSLATTRAMLPDRAVVLAGDRVEAVAGLAALAAGVPAPGVVSGAAGAGGVAVLFSGQGSQRPGMGQELYEAFPVFASTVDEVCAALDRWLDGGEVRRVMFGDDEVLHETGWAQPALFVFEVALFRLFESFGVRAGVLGGHSIGEVVAAYLAGVLSLPDAARLVAARAGLMQALPSGGAMVAVEASEDRVRGVCDGEVSIAAVNGPGSVVLSGAEKAVLAATEVLCEQGCRTKRLRVSHAFHSSLMEPMLDGFRAVVAQLELAEPRIPLLMRGVTEVEYWVEHVRATVRFADGVAALPELGVSTVLEVGPGGTLTGLGSDCLPGESRIGFVAGARGGVPEPRAVLTALAELHVRGIGIDWAAWFTGGKRVDLPTYAFQRERFWLEAPAGTGDVTAAGLRSPGHPLLGAAADLADGGVLFTGLLPEKPVPWLAERAGAVFVELALHAGDETGCPTVDELVVDAPLTLPEQGGIQLQIVVTRPDESGRRALTVHSRAATGESAWTRNATGTLSPQEPAVPPPPGEVQAEVEITDVEITDPEGYGLHPELLHAALDDQELFPAEWHDVTLHASGATSLRVHTTPIGPGSVALHLTDRAGRPVATVGSVTFRPLKHAAAAGSLYRVDWIPCAAGEAEPMTVLTPGLATSLAGAGVPVTVRSLAEAAPAEGLVVAELAGDDVHAVTREALALYQTWLAEPRFAAARLVVLTREGDPGSAAARAMARCAQWESPGRIVLVEIDDDETSLRALASAGTTGEPELAIRSGELRAPRLARAGAGGPAKSFDPNGTVLITGGTGAVGRVVARHLVAEHGVSHLVLAGRRGNTGDGFAELAALGAEVRVEACDVADRDATEKLLDGIAAERPLTAVFHLAGVRDDCALADLTPDRLAAVLRPKADGARNLHDLTRDLDLTAFVLFAAAAGIAGDPGQSAFAAANAVLDELARRRRAEGLPAVSLAWSPWARHGNGIRPMPEDEAMRALDVALGHDYPVLMPVALDVAELRAQALTDAVPPLLRGLIRPGRPAARAIATTLAERLGGLSAADQERELLTLVRNETAAVLGHAADDAVPAERAFGELGFDSLTAVQLRNRLTAATGVRLPTTLVFDHPNPAALARLLRAELAGSGTGGAEAALAGLDRLAGQLAEIPPDSEIEHEVATRLQAMLSRWKERSGPRAPAAAAPRLETASTAALLDFIDRELGRGEGKSGER
jgi:acyl transferase domain-containing protein/acyl carrier protein